MKRKKVSKFDRLWSKLLKMSGNPTEVDKKSVVVMKDSLNRLKGVSPDMRKRLLDKIIFKQCEVAVRDMG